MRAPGPSRQRTAPRWRGGGLPSETFGEAERLQLRATLEQINVLHGDADFAAALKVEPSAAIDVALTVVPIEEISLTSDIGMTALLRYALERNAAAALVLAQVLGLTDLGHSYATELAASWLACGRLYSDDPRKFGDAEIVLLSAFRERQRDGDEAGWRTLVIWACSVKADAQGNSRLPRLLQQAIASQKRHLQIPKATPRRRDNRSKN